MIIYKIFRADEWDTLVDKGMTFGTPVDLADGYIHFSTAQQVAATAEKYFAGEENLVIAAVDAEDFGDAMQWEPAREGDLFPHLYRKLRLCDIMWHKKLPLDKDGKHLFPDGVLR